MGLKKKLLKKKSQKWDVKPNEMLWNNVHNGLLQNRNKTGVKHVIKASLKLAIKENRMWKIGKYFIGHRAVS